MTDIYCGPTVAFEFEEHGTLVVHRFCPKCGRFVANVTATVNQLGDVVRTYATCRRCGGVHPETEGWF